MELARTLAEIAGGHWWVACLLYVASRGAHWTRDWVNALWSVRRFRAASDRRCRDGQADEPISPRISGPRRVAERAGGTAH